MTNSAQIDRIYLEGCDLKDQAIVSLDNLELYLEAACRFEQASQMAHVASTEATGNPERSASLDCLSAYYESEQHYCLSSYEYEQRNTVAAREHARRGLQSLDDAIRLGQSDAFGAELRETMRTHVTLWNYFRISHEAKIHAIEARSYWDEGRYIQALDSYNTAVPLEQRASEFASENSLDQRYIRISRGNAIGMTANASQALAMHMLTQGSNNPDRQGIALSRDIAFQLIRFALNAVRQGSAAYFQNPEWTQYREAAEQCRRNIEHFLRGNSGEWVPLYIEFEGDDQLYKIMKHVDLDRYREVVEMVEIPKNKNVKLWANGSFWLFALSVVVGLVLLVMNQGAGFWTTLLVIVGIEVILAIIGALTLRSTGDLSEGGFLSLMSLVFKAQFQFAKLFKGSTSSDQDGTSQA